VSSLLWFVLGAVTGVVTAAKFRRLLPGPAPWPADEAAIRRAFIAGHTAGIETCSTGTFDVPVAFKFEMWMEE